MACWVRVVLAAALLQFGLAACGDDDSGGAGSNRSGSSEAETLSAQDVFEVSAIQAAKADGFTITSAVCEVVGNRPPSAQAGVVPRGRAS